MYMSNQRKYLTMENLKIGFVLLLLTLLMVRSVNIYSLLPSTIDSILFSCTSFIGVGLIAGDLYQIFISKQKKWRYNAWLLMYLVVIAFSSVLNRQYGWFGNLKFLVWETIYFCVIYMIATDDQMFQRLVRHFINWLIRVWSCLVLVSLGMFLLQFRYQTDFKGKVNPLRIGFLESRLFGIFSDPNYASIICVIVIVLSVYYILTKNWGKGKKGLMIANVFSNMSYITLSGSRNGLINLLCIAFIFGFFAMYVSRYAANKAIWRKSFFALLTGALTAIGVYVLLIGLKMLWAQFPPLFSGLSEQLPIGQNFNDAALDKIDLTRPDVEKSTDVSNLRFKIWNSALEIFKSSWLFGVSPRNIVAYAQANLPETYIAIKNFSTHNAYINILTSTGVVGFVVIMTFFIRSAFGAVKTLFINIASLQDARFYYILCVLSLAFSGFFHNEMILVNTIGSIIFWFFLGKVNVKIRQ